MNWRNLLTWDQQPAKMFEEQLQLLINNIYESGVSGSPELSDCINVSDYKEIVKINKVEDLLSFPDSFRINHPLFGKGIFYSYKEQKYLCFENFIVKLVSDEIVNNLLNYSVQLDFDLSTVICQELYNKGCNNEVLDIKSYYRYFIPKPKYLKATNVLTQNFYFLHPVEGFYRNILNKGQIVACFSDGNVIEYKNILAYPWDQKVIKVTFQK